MTGARWVAIATVVAACSGPQQPGGGAATDLIGLWGSEQVYPTGPSGTLEVVHERGGWTATIAGTSAPLRAEGAWWRGDVGTGELRIHPTSTGDAEAIEAFWIQPSATVLDRAYASPIILQRSGDRYRAEIVPLPDVLRFYLVIRADSHGALTAFVREPNFNVGGMLRDLTVERRGPAVSLRGADGKPVLHGTLDTRRGQPHLALVLEGAGVTVDLTRRGRDDAAGFYPRPSAQSRYVYQPPAAGRDGWPVGTLAAAGMKVEPIRDLVQHVLDESPTSWRSPAIHSIVIARRGVLVLDEYFAGFAADTPHDTRSAGKSWSSALAGVAVDRRELALSTRIAAADPDPRKAAIALEHLLTMSSGLDCDDDNAASPGNEGRMQSQRAERNWYRYMLAVPMVRPPGERAVYCSGALNLIGAALETATGAWIPARWNTDLARPLDIERFYMNLMPGEQGYLAGGVYLRPRDFAKLPQLYLDRGRWRSRPVVSAAWVDSSVEPRVAIHAPRDYGFAWWRITYRVDGVDYPAFYASGNGGQLAIAIPRLDLVVAFNAGNYGDFATWRRFLEDWVPRYVIRAALP